MVIMDWICSFKCIDGTIKLDNKGNYVPSLVSWKFI